MKKFLAISAHAIMITVMTGCSLAHAYEDTYSLKLSIIKADHTRVSTTVNCRRSEVCSISIGYDYSALVRFYRNEYSIRLSGYSGTSQNEECCLFNGVQKYYYFTNTNTSEDLYYKTPKDLAFKPSKFYGRISIEVK